MITTVMAKSMNVMPEEEINEKIAALGPGWKVVSTAVSQTPWGEWDRDMIKCAIHTYFAVVVVLEKPDEPSR